ncbi:MAG: phage terminase large subunit [Alphaproteobacteria bacterium]|nr:phage terminase large subunit [Alphaproteobacteria bacterium]
MNNDKINMLLKNPMAARELLRCDFKLFITVFYFYMSRREFIFKWFHLEIIKKLEALVFGTDKRKNLCITIPPRHGKSEIIKLFLAWTYAVNSQCNNIYTSYSNDLVLKFSAEVRAIIESELFQALFGLKVDKSTKAKANWKILGGGETRAASLGGAITGFGAGGSAAEYGGAIFCDDLLKPGAGATKVKRETCITYYTDVLKSRRNNTTNVPFVLIMQRVHVGDIVGWIKENEPNAWDFVEFKALNEDDSAIWEEKMSAAELIDLRENSPSVFFAQYQQDPIIKGGNLIRTEWFRTYGAPPERFDRMFIVADTAFTEKKSGDYSAFLLCGIFGTKLYLLEGYCNRVIFPDLCRDLKQFYLAANDKYKTRVSAIMIENKGSGQSLIQQLRREGLPISELYPTYMDKRTRTELMTDKYTRFQEMSADLESGYCYTPEYAPWLLEFRSQCEAFTGGAQDEHDDYVDCLIYAMKERAKGIMRAPKAVKLNAMGF